MPQALAELAHSWHDFYLLVGTAAATLVGLMFVAASIGAQVFREDSRGAMEAFISPTVVHFASALCICVVALIPSHRWWTLIGLYALIGLHGLAYSSRIWARLFLRHTFTVDIVDRLFYALIPVLGYVLVVAAAALMVEEFGYGLDLLAAALSVLMLAGIRNAWDMTTWIMLRNGPVPPAPSNPA